MSNGADTALIATQAKATKLGLMDSLRKANEVYGKEFPDMVREIAATAFGDGNFTPQDYFWHRIPALQLDDEGLRQFAGTKRAGITNIVCNDRRWVALCTDKVISPVVLRGLGLPAPEIVALAHPTRACDAELLRDAEAVASFLRTTPTYPLFGKPAGGQQSLGTSSLTRYHADTDELEDLFGSRFPLDRLVAEIRPFLEGGYVFQRRLNPHPDMAERCGPTLSTVRVVTLQDGDGVEVLDAAWKIGVHGQVADNFWRGNLLAGLDLTDGRVTRVLTAPGFEGDEVVAHPDTGATLVGWTLPDWSQALEIALRGMRSLPGLGLVGWDLALTDNGPVLVEVNAGFNWAMVQLANGRGLWRPRVRALAKRRETIYRSWRKKKFADAV